MSKSYCNNSIIKDTLTNSNNVGLLAQNFTSSSVTFAGTAATASKVTIGSTRAPASDKAGQLFYVSSENALYVCITNGSATTNATYVKLDTTTAGDALSVV